MSRNEVRRIEDLNEDPDPDMDKILTPVNMTPEQPEREPEPGPPQPPPVRPMPAPPDDDDPEARAAAERLHQYAHDNAVRVVRRESKALLAKAPKLARDPAGWRAAVLKLYGEHVAHVAEVMRIPEAAARGYCDSQAAAVLAGGAGVIDGWEQEIPPRLVALALGGEA